MEMKNVLSITQNEGVRAVRINYDLKALGNTQNPNKYNGHK